MFVFWSLTMMTRFFALLVLVLSSFVAVGCGGIVNATYECAEGTCASQAVLVDNDYATLDTPYPHSFTMTNEGTEEVFFSAIHLDYTIGLPDYPSVDFEFAPDLNCTVLLDVIAVVSCDGLVIEPGETVRFRFNVQGNWHEMRLVGLFLGIEGTFQTPLTNVGSAQIVWFNN